MHLKVLSNVLGIPGSKSKIAYLPQLVDDPRRRKPDIELARKKFGWVPKVELHEGLQLTIEAFRKKLANKNQF